LGDRARLNFLLQQQMSIVFRNDTREDSKASFKAITSGVFTGKNEFSDVFAKIKDTTYENVGSSVYSTLRTELMTKTKINPPEMGRYLCGKISKMAYDVFNFYASEDDNKSKFTTDLPFLIEYLKKLNNSSLLNEQQKMALTANVKGFISGAVDKLSAGDIGAITKIPSVATGMTLADPKRPVTFDIYEVPNPVQYIGIVAATKNDEDKLSTVLSKVMAEDPTVQLQRNVETSQLLLGGRGMHHLDFVLDKIKRVYKVNLNTEKQKIVYRETIKTVGEATGSYKKQSGGAGFYGVVTMKFEPTTEDSFFTEEVFGGAVPKNYFPAVEKGFFEALEKGPLAGYPVINVHATLLDGKYHDVDSNELSFRMAAILAFKEAYGKCRPVLLEPIMKVRIVVAAQYLGDVISDVSTRRGRISGMEGNDTTQIVEAFIPEAEIIEYSMNLSSLTQGNGVFTREFAGYEEVPSHLVDKIIKEANL
jgi:elongation factor G